MRARAKVNVNTSWTGRRLGLEAVIARVATRLRWLPAAALEPPLLRLEDLDAEGVGDRFTAGTARHADVSLRARGRADEEIRFGEEFPREASARWALPSPHLKTFL